VDVNHDPSRYASNVLEAPIAHQSSVEYPTGRLSSHRRTRYPGARPTGATALTPHCLGAMEKPQTDGFNKKAEHHHGASVSSLKMSKEHARKGQVIA